MAEARTYKAKVVNVGVNGGDDVTIPFTITQDGAVVNISTWTFTFEVFANSKPGETAILTKAGTVTDGPNGEGAIVLVPGDFANLPQDVYFYRLKETAPTSTTRLKGKFDVD